MRLVFAGTPEFAERALAALVDSGHEVALVLTQPDRPAGRGMQATPSAVKRFALQRGLALEQPERLSPEIAARLHQLHPDALVVAAYGLLVPQAILDVAPNGALNIHASLLPRWRGAAPIQRALLAGDRETGISIMKMDAGLDTGPVLAQRGVEISDEDDAGTLHDKLAALGAHMIVAELARVAAGRAVPAPQAAQGATYARKVDKRETLLDWSRPAAELERAVRAFRPAPGASAMLQGEPLKLWRARVTQDRGEPGKVLRAGEEIVIACGENALAVSELQRAGGRRLSAAQFLRGRALAPGTSFG